MTKHSDNPRGGQSPAATDLRVLIVSEHASVRFGGEAILPWHYFRLLRKRGIEAWLIVHERTRDELLALLPHEADRMIFVKDRSIHRVLWQVGRRLPARVAYFTCGYASRLLTQIIARNEARRLVAKYGIQVVHQPIPVSPRETSLMFGLGAPVVMGPMNGNMNYPPAFLQEVGRVGQVLTRLGRAVSRWLHWLMPGKLKASRLLVANERTRQALPTQVRESAVVLVENGVDLPLWSFSDRTNRDDRPVRFVFMGRLVGWKAVDLLLEALARVQWGRRVELMVLGDGPERDRLRRLAGALGISDLVQFSGWLSQEECSLQLRDADVLLLPRLYEGGGAVVLEAMACGLPVIATAWGGPADYLNDQCGVLVRPTSREGLIAGFADAMSLLEGNRELRVTMGKLGRQRVEQTFDWEVKLDQMLAIYEDVVRGALPE